MKLGDVIAAIDGKKVASVNDLFLLTEAYKVGEVVAVTVLREGKREQIRVTLEPLN